MNRYIDADKVLNDIECIDISDCTDIDDILIEVEKTIDKQPTADVQEVRRGRWLYEDSDIGWTDYKCYDCGNIISTVNQDEDLYSYCPYCGARMDGETE